MPEGCDTVLPVYLLAFLVGAPRVRDGRLVDAAPLLCYLCRYLGLEAEPVRFEPYVAGHLRPEGLVSRLHVREVQVGEHVREECEHLVSYHVPEEEHPVGAPACEARAVYDVGLALEYWLGEVRGVPPGGLQVGGLAVY